jgi:ankyrin repeat protein
LGCIKDKDLLKLKDTLFSMEIENRSVILNTLDENGENLLFHACRTNDSGIILFLLEQGCSELVFNKENKKAIEYCDPLCSGYVRGMTINIFYISEY